MTSEVKELMERLQGLLDGARLPWRAEDGPEYAELVCQGFEKVALTIKPDLIVTAINALPTLLDTLQSQERRIGELCEALERITSANPHGDGAADFLHAIYLGKHTLNLEASNG